MSYNGTGTFVINTSGQPVVSGTTITSTAFNALTSDLATGLSTAICKDGQTIVTANIPLNGFKLTGVGAPTTTNDALTYSQPAVVSTLIIGSLSGLLKGNGSGSVITAASAGTDYAVPTSANTWTGTQTFSGATGSLAEILTNSAEVVTVSATASTGTINFDVTTQSVLYYTTNASANFNINIRGNSSTTLNSLMSTGQCITLVFMAAQGTTPYNNTAVTIDGSAVTPKYQNGAAWLGGNASGIDVYVYTVIKTGSATYTVLAGQTQFK
jgi:hypothetical protein